MLNIKFKVADKEYRLKSSHYDFTLYDVKYVQSGKNKGNEDLNIVGFFGVLGNALAYIPEHHLRNTDIEDLKELNEEMQKMMKDLREQANNIIAECYITPEDLEAQKVKAEKMRKE